MSRVVDVEGGGLALGVVAGVGTEGEVLSGGGAVGGPRAADVDGAGVEVVDAKGGTPSPTALAVTIWSVAVSLSLAPPCWFLCAVVLVSASSRPRGTPPIPQSIASWPAPAPPLVVVVSLSFTLTLTLTLTRRPTSSPRISIESPQSVSPPTKQVASADVDEFDMFSAAELHERGLSPVSLPPAPGHGDAVVSSNCDDPEGYYQPTAGEVLNGTYQKHCVRLLERFEHRGHVALVFESMQMNLREAMKKFGGRGGISVQAVRVFCKHMLIALSHLESSGVVHADIKPDNILLDEKQTMVKLCDFGSAFKVDEGKHDPTPYLMFTGKVMFPGATNNEMLKLFMELKGKFPNKTIKKHRQAYIDQIQMEPHFTEDNKFCSREIDRVTGKPVLRVLDAIKTKFDLGAALLSAKSSTDDRKQVLELRNLLERMFTLDPAKRISAKEALAHPFVRLEGGK
ncbi:hypothetical protein P43SY_000716 [Pythium insidiosum]|uniref:Protein kinase domain-containing protein n=1 Tax=Pythium insidiosum TaxID=114742 RepID=A0AAD5MIA0_PYTIN|nr:hypothetical protein P43SY_000716 [Pythium insidiosum]